jgi:hypothetical protein
MVGFSGQNNGFCQAFCPIRHQTPSLAEGVVPIVGLAGELRNSHSQQFHGKPCFLKTKDLMKKAANLMMA